MSGEGDHESDRSAGSRREEPPKAPPMVVVDSNDSAVFQMRTEEFFTRMTNTFAEAMRNNMAASNPAPQPSRHKEPITPRGLRKSKGKATFPSFSNSQDEVGLVARRDFYDSDEHREFQAYMAHKAAKEARRKQKEHDKRYGVGTSTTAAKQRYNRSPSTYDVDKFKGHQSPISPHSEDDEDADAHTDAEEFADDRHHVEGNSHAHYSNLPPLYDSPEMQVCSRDYLPPPKDPKLSAIHDAEVARAARTTARPRATRRRNTPSPPPSGDDSPGSDEGRDRRCHPPRRREPAHNRATDDRRDNADRRTDPVASSRRDVKVKFDYFEGSYDPNIFLEWVQTIEHTLRHCRYEPEEVVDVVTLHFRGAARTWWHRYESDRRRRNLQPVRDWDQLVHVMTRKYVPSNYREKMRYDVATAT